MSKKYENLEANQTGISLDDFKDSYNSDIPKGFPRASTKTLKDFQDSYPSLFHSKDERKWTIDRHRKRYMDWLFTYDKKNS